MTNTNGAPPDFPAFSGDGIFYLIMEAAAAFRFRHDGNAVLRLATASGRSDVTLETEYAESGLPRPICRIRVLASGENFVSAGTAWHNHASGLVNCVAVATNSAVMDVQPLYVVDVTPGKDKRQFYQQESSLPRPQVPGETRLVTNDVLDFAVSFFDEFDGRDRMMRAMQQYVLALRYRTPDTKTLALAHAFMAAEALVPVARRKMLEDGSMTLEQMASLGAKNAGWSGEIRNLPKAADIHARLAFVFHGDQVTFKKASDMSNGFEHGYEDFAELIRLSIEAVEPAMDHIRRAIIDLSPATTMVKDALLAEPRFKTSLSLHGHSIVTGTLLETPSDADWTPPIDLSNAAPIIDRYDEVSGAYQFSVNLKAQARRNGIGPEISISKQP